MTDLRHERMLIGGREVSAAGGRSLDVTDPATGRRVATVPRGGQEDVDLAVNAAREAVVHGSPWRTLSPRVRGDLLRAVAAAIRAQAAELASLEVLDTGKPVSQAAGEVEAAARTFDFVAGATDKLGGGTIPVGPGVLDLTLREPWGVCAQITPWNYPLALAVRGVAPALAMGNAVVLKPAEEASLSCLHLARLALHAGLPPGVLNVVSGLGEEAGAALAGHPGIDHLSFTGSVEVGTIVMQLAARNIVPVSLELGGKSPHIVLPDADLDKAIPTIVRSFVANAGQTCSAGTRLLVDQRIHEVVVEALVQALAKVRVGLPAEDPDLGPLISERQRSRVLTYIQSGLDEGLTLLAGGAPPTDPRLAHGYFLEPTLFDHTPPTSRLFREEIFGPVLCVTPFRDLDEAVRLANATEFGLQTAVWTQDVSVALHLAHRVESGLVYVNSYGVAENAGVPFGGYKKSGFGRERGLESLLGYTRLKNVAVSFA